MPADAFLKTLGLIETPGWVAFDGEVDFLLDEDTSGFCELLPDLRRQEVIQIQSPRRNRIRVAIDGRPLHYVAVIARKLNDLPDGWFGGSD